MKQFFQKIYRLSLPVKIIFMVTLLGCGLLIKTFVFKSPLEVQYQTSKIEKGALINSVSASGLISSVGSTGITTKVSGTVKKVYVTNGDTVKKGQVLAEISLDDYAKERQTAAWVSYLESTEAVKESINAKAVSDIQMWEDREAVLAAQEALNDMNEDNTNPTTHAAYTDGERMIITKTLDQSRKAFSVSEIKYLNSDADISYSYAKIAAALRNYQENSAIVIAPDSGTISDFSLATGTMLTANSSTSNTSGATIVSTQTIGKINSSQSQLIAKVNLSEVDITRVKANQKVTLTLDAYSDMSFTGIVLAVNTAGSVTSGVTSYPVTILLDTTTVEIYPNMSVTAEIITNIKTDIILAPSSAVSSNNGTSTVQVKKNDQINTVEVKTGISNDTLTEITSGLNEGDEVVTSEISSADSQTNVNSTSPFSGFGGSGSTRIMQGDHPGGF
jgi:multidrug efflux pump subunit AcrA (membrane-fusion protein)